MRRSGTATTAACYRVKKRGNPERVLGRVLGRVLRKSGVLGCKLEVLEAMYSVVVAKTLCSQLQKDHTQTPPPKMFQRLVL